MSSAEPIDPNRPQRALRSGGLLATFNATDVLAAADVHVAARLAELTGETDESVMLAVALAVRAVRHGSVSLDLASAAGLVAGDSVSVTVAAPLPWPEPAGWLSAVAGNALVGPGRPLRLDDGRLYLDRYWQQEQQVCTDLLAREVAPQPVVDEARLAGGLLRLFRDESSSRHGDQADHADQRRAARLTATRWTTIIGGGPGTGKTTTVARVLALLLDQPGPRPRIALAAPTGKAATRLQEAVRQVAGSLDPADRHDLPTITASTLHRLLGWTPRNTTRFRHDRRHPLPYDIVVVDETSMVSLTLMARLLEALRPDTRLVLLGDPDQLASVEAGAVLADLVGGLQGRAQHGVAVLGRTFRFGGAIADLATAIRAGDATAAIAVLDRGDPAVRLVADADEARADVLAAGRALRAAAVAGDGPGALAAVDQHRLLCGHRTGPLGVSEWSRLIQRWLTAAGVAEPGPGGWYPGQPLLITENDYALGLFNGDVGVVMGTETGELRAAFAEVGGGIRSFAPRRLGAAVPVHAMTVHRGQGSQFDAVTLVLPDANSPLATRELLYTAVTRARAHVRLIGDAEAVRAAVGRPAARASGLRQRLSAAPG